MNIIKKSQSLFFNKWFFINISVFFYMTVLLVNFFYNTYNSYKETNINLGSYEKNLPENKKLNIDVWYEEETNLWLKASFDKKGYWEYRLKIIN